MITFRSVGNVFASVLSSIHTGLKAVEKILPSIQQDAQIVEGVTALIPGGGAQTALAVERVAFGVLGDVAHSTVNSTQSVNYTQADLTELRGIVDQISSATGQLPGDAQRQVVAAVADARKELEAGQPHHGRLRAALTSIRATCEGAAGNLIAAGIVGLISKFLS